MAKERLARLRESRARQAQQSDYTKQLQELEQTRAAIQAEKQKLELLKKDPIAAFRELGLSPDEFFNQLQDHLAVDDPNAQQRLKLKELREQQSREREELLKEIEQLKSWKQQQEEQQKQTQQQYYEMQRQAAEKEFFSIAASRPDTQEILQTFGPEALLRAAYAVTEQLRANRQDDGYEAVLGKLVENFQAFKKKLVDKPSEVAQNVQVANKTFSGSPRNLGNSVVQEVASNGEREISQEERRRQRGAALIATWAKKSSSR